MLAAVPRPFQAQRTDRKVRKAAPPLSQDIRIDPFTGHYFGYQLTKDGPRIYSLSENGIDDGGIHSPNWDTEIDNGKNASRSRSDDHVFWPPQEVPRK